LTSFSEALREEINDQGKILKFGFLFHSQSHFIKQILVVVDFPSLELSPGAQSPNEEGVSGLSLDQ
jgi:predicted aldo/keto reductase-like oxidoreductase